MTVMFTDRQFEKVQSTTRELRRITKSIRTTQRISAAQREQLIKVSRRLTDSLAEHQR